MPDMTYDRLNSQQSGETGNFLHDAANAAADVVCAVYAAAPTGIIPSFGDPSGIGRMTQGMLADLCHPRNQRPPDPAPPFTGGQCQDWYTDIVNWNQGNQNGIANSGQDYGKRSGLRSEKIPGKKAINVYITITPGGNLATYEKRIAGALGYEDVNGEVTFSYAPRRESGQPDNCGNPTPVYPTPLPVNPTYGPIIINPSPTIIFNSPVTIIPTLIQPTINFRPELNVDVGGIVVNFNLGGINFNLSQPPILPPGLPPGSNYPSPNYDPRPNPPAPIQPKPDPSKPVQPDFTELKQLLNKIKDCACEPDYVIETVVIGNGKGSMFALPSGSLYVNLNLSIGSNTRYQASEGSAPDLYYAGWLAFGSSDGFGVRTPMSFRQSSYAVPEGAAYCAYSLVFDSSATVSVVRKRRVSPS